MQNAFNYFFFGTRPEAPPWCCKISSIGLAHCPSLQPCDWKCSSREKAASLVSAIWTCLLYVLSHATHALDMGYSHIGSAIDQVSDSVGVFVSHRNEWIILCMVVVVCLLLLSVGALVMHVVDICNELKNSLHEFYTALWLMVYHCCESWKNGLCMIPPFMGFLVQVLRLVVFAVPFLLMFEVYVAGFGLDWCTKLGGVICYLVTLMLWFLKNKTGWDVFSKVMSVFRNPRLQADFESLNATLENVTTVRSTVPAANTTAPLQDIQAQLRELQRQLASPNQWGASHF